MKSVRTLYDRLPAGTRSKFRSLMPRSLLRWYSHRRTDAYLVSYPKCGRTWLRLMMGRAIARHFLLPENEDILFIRWKKRPHPAVPMIRVEHEDHPMFKAPGELETSKAHFRDKKVIFLARDPRDVIVSSYFERSKRTQIFGENPYEKRQAVFEGSLSEFINQPIGGFDTLLCYYNIWADNRSLPAGFLLVRYEDLKADPQRELRRVLNFLGLQIISDDTLAEAVEYASFENMRKMESSGKFQSGMLSPGSQDDQDSYKTRKGQIKGYINYLNEKEIQDLNHKLATNLSNFFGYLP